MKDSKDAAKKMMRNSTTNKKEWDKFIRQSMNKNLFPPRLAAAFVKQKNELFNMWLDTGEDWDAVACEAERKNQTSTLNRNQWQAVQAREVIQKYGKERGTEIIEKRKAASLYYLDEDFPDDPMDPRDLFQQGFQKNHLRLYFFIFSGSHCSKPRAENRLNYDPPTLVTQNGFRRPGSTCRLAA